MLDIKVVREDPTAVSAALKLKGYEFPVEPFLELDARRKQADIRAQSLLADRKSASKKSVNWSDRGAVLMKPKRKWLSF